MNRPTTERTVQLLHRLGCKSAKVQRPTSSNTKKGAGREWRVSVSGDDAFRIIELIHKGSILAVRARRPWYRRVFNP